MRNLIILSLSMNLITGYMGIVVLGQAAFFGVGAYTAAIMATRFQTDFILNCILAALICAVFGLMIGSPTLRLQGSYLSIVTLGFGEIMCIIELNWIELTRGPYGINNIPMPRILGFEINNARGFYYLVLALCLLTILVVHNITDSRTGRAFSAIKGDEIAAQSMGVNMFSYKLQCFAVSAAIAGVAGAFYAQYMSFVDSTTFTSDQSFQILGMTILNTEHITQRFGGLVAVSDVNVSLNDNEIVGIIGPNGAGKTTFFNCITGVYNPTEGRVIFQGADITGKKPHQITGLGMARTFQNIRLFTNMTALENVMLGTHTHTKANLLDSVLRLPRHRRDEARAREKALETLEITGLSQWKYQYASSLPYGLQRRLEIARAMASEPKVLLLDEPAAGMNEQETHELMEFILELKGMGLAILLIEHDMRLVMRICDHIYVLDHGAEIAHGTPEEIRQNQLVIDAYLGKEVK